MNKDKSFSVFWPQIENDSGVIIACPKKVINNKKEAIAWLEKNKYRRDIRFILKEIKYTELNFKTNYQ